MSARRGMSLVELLVVMSAATVILTMSAELIHRIMIANSKARSFADVERISMRLANTFRRDIHEANDASFGDSAGTDGVLLRLAIQGNQTIEYRREQATVVRILLDTGKPVSRDEFALPPGIELAIRKDESRMVILSIKSCPGELPVDDGGSQANAFAVPVNLQVEALLSRGNWVAPVVPDAGGTQ